MFRTIPEFSNYEIDPRGNVRNVKTGKFLKCYPNEDGYLTFQLWRNGKPYKYSRARLILLAHAPIPLYLWPDMEAAHKNGIRHDDRFPENIRWRSHSQNMQEIGKDFLSGDLF